MLYYDRIHCFFEQVSSYQHAQAVDELASYEVKEEESDLLTQWWEDIALVLKLLASCESTYGLMTYLDEEWIHGKKIDQLYHKLIIALSQHAEELRQEVKQMARIHVKEDQNQIVRLLTLEKANFFIELFEESMHFFQIRLKMVRIYRDLAIGILPIDYSHFIRQLSEFERLHQGFANPLLQKLQLGMIYEIKAVRAGMEAQHAIETLVMHKALVYLHKLKATLAEWRNLLDEGSDSESESDGSGKETQTASSLDEAQQMATFDRKQRRSSDSIGSMIPFENVDKVVRSLSMTPPSAFAVSFRPPLDINNMSRNSASSHYSSFDEGDEESGLETYVWSRRFYMSLSAKFALYFYSAIAEFEDPHTIEFNQVKNNAGVSYLAAINDFLTRYNSGNTTRTMVALIFESITMNVTAPYYHHKGYVCPPMPFDTFNSLSDKSMSGSPVADEAEHEFSKLSGLKAWPAIFICPTMIPPEKHWTHIVNLICENRVQLNSKNAPVYNYDKKSGSYYYLRHIDTQVTLVVVVDDRRRVMDKSVVDFIHTLSRSLQHFDVFRRAKELP